MKVCFCRFLLAAAIVVIALLWWATAWAKIAVIVGAGLLAIASLSYRSCCCRTIQEQAAAEARPPDQP